MTPADSAPALRPGVNKIEVPVLARVEGEGELHIKTKSGKILDLKLRIPEPPRLFEGFLRGRHFMEVPDITARICGICPIAYQMSSIHALERALGVQVHPSVRALRRLFYCGEWIESHVLHIFFLHLPDFLGCQDAFEVAAKNADAVRMALRLKKLGNEIVRVMGGREIHPVSACVGGFWRAPRREELEALVPELEWALDASLQAVSLTASLEFPDFEQDYEFVALSHPEEYALNEGRIVSSRGLDIDAAQFEEHSIEQHVKHSNALHSVMRERGSYMVGPLARFNLNFAQLTGKARQAAAQAGLVPPVRNPFRSIVVRAVETVFAVEEALRIIAAYEPPPAPRLEVRPAPGAGAAATEAPRGLLYHRYAVDENGLITEARIVPPTAQNLRRIEEDLWGYVPKLLSLDNDQIAWRAEMAVRNYDPCISCATHFLKLRREDV
ncbi:MAG: Ni/Fe hydrogenase subunit alpha [Bryobacteraceae bacterium]|nr:Ni/Fe hydrogenase subunit alpha [Bryobacteraceae bacterium]MCX7602914.1 Ni/Fe hydrogenase subunit alpha [Bryobacteraceae bacterium]